MVGLFHPDVRECDPYLSTDGMLAQAAGLLSKALGVLMIGHLQEDNANYTYGDEIEPSGALGEVYSAYHDEILEIIRGIDSELTKPKYTTVRK